MVGVTVNCTQSRVLTIDKYLYSYARNTVGKNILHKLKKEKSEIFQIWQLTNH